MVGPLTRGDHRCAPSMVGVALRPVGPLGPPEVVVHPRPLANPLSGYSHLPQVLRPVEPHAAIPRWPPKRLRVDGACTGAVPPAPDHQRVIHLLGGGRGAAYNGHGEQLCHDLGGQGHHCRVGAKRWCLICPRMSSLTAKMLRGAVGFLCSKKSVPMYRSTVTVGALWSVGGLAPWSPRCV